MNSSQLTVVFTIDIHVGGGRGGTSLLLCGLCIEMAKKRHVNSQDCKVLKLAFKQVFFFLFFFNGS